MIRDFWWGWKIHFPIVFCGELRGKRGGKRRSHLNRIFVGNLAEKN